MYNIGALTQLPPFFDLLGRMRGEVGVQWEGASCSPSNTPSTTPCASLPCLWHWPLRKCCERRAEALVLSAQILKVAPPAATP